MEEQIEKQLGEFPSCFRTYHFVEKLGRNIAQKILDKSKTEIGVSGYESDMEEIRALNFMSYMSFAVGKLEDAKEYNNKALEKNHQNINAIVIKTRLHLYESEFAKSKEQCFLLETLKTNELQMLYGKAEQAYTCSRLGMKLYDDAERLFYEVICESERVGVPKYEICMWKFGLALTLKRQININNCHKENIKYVGQEIKKCNKVLQIFLDITKMDAPGIDKHRARSFVQLGEILNLLFSRHQTVNINEHIFHALPGKGAKSKAENCYESGFRLDQNDVFVLERFAKYCRLRGQIDKSIELCRQAINTRGTSIGHHYLALALRKKLEGDQKRSNRKTNTVPSQHKPHHVRKLQMETPIQQTAHAAQSDDVFSGPDSGIASMESHESTRESAIAHFSDELDLTVPNFRGDNYIEKPKCLANPEVTGETNDINEVTKGLLNLRLPSRTDQSDYVHSPNKEIHSECRNEHTNEPLYQNRDDRGRGQRKTQNRRGTFPGNHYQLQGCTDDHMYEPWHENRDGRGRGQRIAQNRRGPFFGDPYQWHRCRGDHTNEPLYQSRNDRGMGQMREAFSGNRCQWQGGQKQKSEYKGQHSSHNSRNGNRGGNRHRSMPPGASNMSGAEHREFERGLSFEEKALTKLVKSPKKVIPLPKDKINEIVFHLDKACELSENVAALYDKGLTYRAAGQLDDALSIFKSMFRNKACSLVNLANAYEQSVHCLQHQLESSEDETVLERIQFDVKEYSVKAIEIQWSLIAKQPSLKQCWSSFPTLKCLLEKDPSSISNRKELGILHRMVRDYRGAIGWFKQVLEMETEECGKATVHMDIVHNCLKAGDYDEAILHLDMVQGLSNPATTVDENLFFEAHIEGALRSFSAKEEEMSRLRLKNALDFYREAENQRCVGNNGQVSEYEEFIQPEWFDVFILSDQKLETIARNIWRLLSSLGLEATVNDDFAAPNLPRSVGLSEVIERSTHTILVLGNDMDNLRHIQISTESVRNEQDERRYGNLIVVKENESVKAGAVFRGFRSLTYKEGVDSLTPSNRQWIKELLWMIASGRDYVPF